MNEWTYAIAPKVAPIRFAPSISESSIPPKMIPGTISREPLTIACNRVRVVVQTKERVETYIFSRVHVETPHATKALERVHRHKTLGAESSEWTYSPLVFDLRHG